MFEYVGIKISEITSDNIISPLKPLKLQTHSIKN